MKKNLITLTLTLLLLLSMLTGCSASASIPDETQVPLNDKPEAVDTVTVTPDASEVITDIPADTPSVTYVSPSPEQITQAQAIEIALAHAGLTADEVQYLYTEYEIDDRIPQYDVDFRKDRMEYDYEIHAETGDILSFEIDD